MFSLYRHKVNSRRGLDELIQRGAEDKEKRFPWGGKLDSGIVTSFSVDTNLINSRQIQ